MNAKLETLNPVWDDTRDAAFFRLVADVLPQAMVFAAGVLLASYDDEGDLNECHAVAGGVTLAR